MLYIIILRYEEISPSKSNNQLSCSEQWSTYATTVDAGFQELLDWIKQNCQDNVDHHNILAGWCLSLSQRFLIMFTKVCDVLSTKFALNSFEQLLAMIGLDSSDNCVCNQCHSHKSPDGDLHGDQIFKLVGMELTLDCKKMMSMRPIQFIETAQMCQNPTLTTTGIGWNVKTHFNWFDKMVNITKFKAKPPSMLGRKWKIYARHKKVFGSTKH